MGSSLRKYQTNPKTLLETAINFYRSKKIKTAIVEGACDRRFIQQWCKTDAPLRFDGFDGKALVEQAYAGSQIGAFSKHDFLYFFSDIDYDAISGRPIIHNPRYINNAYCQAKRQAEYNDLEIFLVNTIALEKVLSNQDIEPSEANSIRDRLEQCSCLVGSFRAADITLSKRLGLNRSILNGLEPGTFFNSKSISVDYKSMIDQMPRWANYPHYIDDLIDEAEALRKRHVVKWSLSRGHDVTEFLSLYLVERGSRGLSRERLELMLRLACELTDYKSSAMGRQLLAAGPDECFLV